MKLNTQTPKQSLNKAFLKQPVNRDDITLFKTKLQVLLGKINPNEGEEHHKFFVRDFLRDTFYKSDYEMNTKGKQDLVIHVGKDASNKVGVILEAKKPSPTAEMISADNPNKKALHELILYYLNERNEADNFELKNLVITDIYQWFIFDANYFDKQIYRNAQIKRLYQTYKTDKKDNPFFYGELQKIIAKLDETIDCAVFDIRDYETALNNADLKDDESLIELFKILSPQHLLKVPFADDSNKLDKNFYTELLHIVGLEETKDKGKLKIDRKAKERRDAGSLIENAVAIIETKDSLHKVKNLESYGAARDERLFGVALELCLTWINRVLFLKLLEAQLVDYHKGNRDYRFLDIQTIQDFDELFTLFHQVLAKLPEDRNPDIQTKYNRVPYLNSSLFEISELETDTITIESLKNTIELPFNNSSILKNGRNQQTGLPTLEYLFKFLDAYDFASEGAEGIKENNRSLINASVLGKIFEKVNNAKAGSIYTPGFITMYMCRQAIRLAVVQKFKDAYGWNISEFADIKNYLADRRSKTDILEFNALINSLHLCDPAVGSGHFLVSSLNEIIAIKCELGILADENGGRFADVEITIENDELIVFDTAKSEFFKYQINADGKPNSREAQRLQKTLFHEKQTLIENCLFGVDIIPHSVKICRLRLWIELLKNAYYKESSNYVELETLPNIDINIKEGNSLVSRFALDEDLKEVLKNKKNIVEQYRTAVADYKRERNRDKKRELLRIIDEIKGDFQTEIYKHHPKMVELARRERRLFEINSPQLFDKYSDGERETLSGNLEKQISEIKQEIEAIKSNVIYRNAFEWRFEFPEVLDDEGNFLGFDIIIGNPPYIRQEELGTLKDYLKKDYKVFVSSGDIFFYFYELGFKILNKDGKFAFINNTFDKTNAGKILREFVLEQFSVKEYIDFTSVTVFDGLTTYPIILIAEKSEPQNKFNFLKFSKDSDKNFQALFDKNLFSSISTKSLNSSAWNFLNPNENELLQKINKHDSIFDIYGKCYRGIITGLNEAFISENNLGDYFELKPVYEGKDIKKWNVPEPFKKMIVFQNKSTRENYGKLSEKEAFEKMSEDFPEIMRYLLPFENDAKKRFDKGEFWWELRNCAYYSLFEKTKIIFPNLQNSNKFAFDETRAYLNAPAVFLPTGDKFLLAVLNSKVVWHFLKSICVIRSGGFIEVKPQYFEQIPIPKIKEKDQQPFVALVDKILELKKAGKETLALENEIDRLVYRLYDLTDEEIAIVEGK